MKFLGEKALRKVLFTVSSVVLLFASQFSHAQVSATDLPDLGNLGLLIGEASVDFSDESVLNDEGRISAGMPVNDSLRGTTATEIASILAQGDLDSQQHVEQWLDEARAAVEDFLFQSNFEVNDIGVSLALSFVTFWELAENRVLSDEAELKLGKFLVHTFKGMATEPAYQNLSSEDKSLLYDWTMTTPIAFYSMVDGLEAEGNFGEANKLRQKSASLFVEVFKFPHDLFILTEGGEISFNIDTITDYQDQNGLSDDW